MKRHLRKTLLFLALGLVTTLAIAWLLALLADVQLGRQSQGSAFIDDEQWSVTRWDRAGAIQIKSVRLRGLNWSPQQAAGAPDTRALGDQVTAWASAGSDTGTEWLLLEYAQAVIPRAAHVYESCAPGALFKVSIFDASDNELDAWSGPDPTPANSPTNGSAVPVSVVPIALNVPTRKVKIYLACDKVPGWNEIDAVALVSDKGELQWARRVQASSTYASGNGSSGGGNPELLIPSWSSLNRPAGPMETGLANREERQIDARGWPLVALMSEVDNLASSTVANPATPSGFGGRTLNAYQNRPAGAFAITTPSPYRAPVPIPLRPIWVGLIGDTALFAIVWLTTWSVLTVPRRFFCEVARFRRGACIECGYDLGYDFIHGCPECGWRRDRQDRASATSSTTISPTIKTD